jgi:SAM-dependent methyltransferase
MMRWLRQPAGDPLPVSMSSIKLGDRLLVVGCSDIGLIAALAAKAGLTGRTCIVDASAAVKDRAAAGVEREGALVESFTSPYSSLPFEFDSFDVVVLRNVLRMVDEDLRRQLTAEAHRVLRHGGRCIVIEGNRRGGLTHLFKGDRGKELPEAPDVEEMLKRSGFRAVRTLAAREGLMFVEGVRPGAG